MTSFAHLETEGRYWRTVIADKLRDIGNSLRWDVQADYEQDTIFLKILRAGDVGQIQKHPDLVRRIDLDRKRRTEEEIRAEIDTVIKDLG